MKKVIIFSILFILLKVNPSLAHEVAPPPSPSYDTQGSTLQDAMALVEIYYKIRLLSGEKGEASELKPYLDQLNKALDHLVTFKESFTPEKQAKVMKQLGTVKKEVGKFADIPPSKMKGQLPKLSESIWDLVQVLLQ